MSAPRTLEEKQAERDRLMKAYRAHKREEWTELCEAEPRLAGFKTALRREREPRVIARKLADSWLRRADPRVRFRALQLIEQHSQRERRYLGLQPLDDPLPPARTLFMVAKELLAVR